MRVEDVMTERVETVSPTTDTNTAREVMRTKGVHHLVVRRGSRVVGLLSDRDLGGPAGVALTTGRSVAEVMTTRVVTVKPTMTVRGAANLMRGRSIGCLVVMDRGRLVGIVTAADLLELLGRGAERPAPTARRWTLRHRTPHRKRPVASGMW
jgi:CBS domain-containing protein